MAEQEKTNQEEVQVEETKTTSKSKAPAKKGGSKKQKLEIPTEVKEPDNRAEAVEYDEAERRVELNIRRVSHLMDRNDEIPEEIKKGAMTRLGSALVGQQPVKGLTKREIDVLLPQVIDEEPGTPQFSTAMKNYFDEKTINVGPSGVKIVVGKSEDEDIVPLEGHIEDYVTYRWAKAHPQVAETKEKAEKDPNKNYYIYDPEEDKEKRKIKGKVKKNAMIKYAEILEDEPYTDQMLKLFPEYCSISDLYNMDTSDKEIVLQRIVEEKPEEFLEAADDDNLAIYAEIEEMVAANIIDRNDTVYYYKDDLIGRGKDKVVAAFKSKEFAQQVNSMRKQLEVYRDQKGYSAT